MQKAPYMQEKLKICGLNCSLFLESVLEVINSFGSKLIWGIRISGDSKIKCLWMLVTLFCPSCGE